MVVFTYIYHNYKNQPNIGEYTINIHKWILSDISGVLNRWIPEQQKCHVILVVSVAGKGLHSTDMYLSPQDDTSGHFLSFLFLKTCEISRHPDLNV